MKPNTAIHLLLGVAVLTAMGLLYLIVIHPGQPGLSPSRWALFAVLSLILILAAFAPILVRRWRGLPAPQPPTPSDVRFFIALIASSVPSHCRQSTHWGRSVRSSLCSFRSHLSFALDDGVRSKPSDQNPESFVGEKHVSDRTLVAIVLPVGVWFEGTSALLVE